MKKLLTLGRNNQVVGVSTYNTRSVVVPEGAIDVTDIEVPNDVKINPQNWTFENGAFREFTDQEKSNNDFPDEVYWNTLRNERTELLDKSDWTQVADAPVDKSAWATYRQQLRDLPANTTDPRNTTWPTQPS